MPGPASHRTPACSPASSPRLRQRGFAMMEYCIVCALVVMVLFTNPNTPQLLVNAVKAFYRSLTFFISLP